MSGRSVFCGIWSGLHVPVIFYFGATTNWIIPQAGTCAMTEYSYRSIIPKTARTGNSVLCCGGLTIPIFGHNTMVASVGRTNENAFCVDYIFRFNFLYY